jgi:RNA polymerase sigma-70 factor (ECF subfamily)
VNESNLIRQAQQGDPDAWETLVKEHQAAIFRLAYLLLGDPDDADDAAQETFLRAYYALGRFDITRPLRPWLMQIASRLASNRRRSLGRYLNILMRLAREPTGKTLPMAPDDSQSLWQAVRMLKFEHQQIIYLRYFLDESEQEMSETLEIPIGTVKSRLHRALGALRQEIARNYPQLEESLIP